MNTDTLRDIMLYLPYKDVLAMCSSYQLGHQACHNDFWKNKIKLDFDITPRSTNYKEEYKKLHKISILVNQFLYVLDSLIDEYSTNYTKYVFITFTLSNTYFYDDLYQIYFNITKKNKIPIVEINYDYENNLKDTEEVIDIDELKKRIIALMYKYPNLIIREGIHEYPFMYNELLMWQTDLVKKQQLLKLWEDVISGYKI